MVIYSLWTKEYFSLGASVSHRGEFWFDRRIGRGYYADRFWINNGSAADTYSAVEAGIRVPCQRN